MNNILPAGWRVSNSTGSWTVPAPPPDSDSGSDDDGAVPNLTEEDLQPDSPGWEDVEDDTEQASFLCLLCDEKHDGVRKMVLHCKTAHDVDLDRIRKEHNLDFLATIQLINYIRAKVRQGSTNVDLSGGNEVFVKDYYLQPAMEDDALLYSIDELADPDDPDDLLGQQPEEAVAAGEGKGHKAVAERALR